MSYPAAVIANAFLRLGIEENVPIDPMKLQKLVYLTHGWSLAFRGTPLVKEGFEAWKYGPVVQSLYSTFREFRSLPIRDKFALVPNGEPAIDSDTQSLLRAVWNKYKGNTSIELSMYTHEADYAWDKARRGHENDWSSPIISNTLIKDEFEKRREASR